MDKDKLKKKFLKEHPKFNQRSYTRKHNYDLVTKETVKEIIKLYPHKRNRDIAEELGFGESQFNMIIGYLKKAGLVLEKENSEISMSFILKKIVDEIKSEQ